MKKKKSKFGRLLLEATTIIVSVFLAIYLESIASDNSKRDDALVTLQQMLVELKSDHADFIEVIEEQRNLQKIYSNLDIWLKDINRIPHDSVANAFAIIGTTNRTVFPRNAAWTTMVASGQTGLLLSPELQGRVGNLYERDYQRIAYNGALYDANLDHLTNVLEEFLDVKTARLIENKQSNLIRISNTVHYMRLNWNDFYLNLCIGYSEQVSLLVTDLDRHLKTIQ